MSLSVLTIASIKAALKEGTLSKAEIARRHGTSRGTVYAISVGILHKDVVAAEEATDVGPCPRSIALEAEVTSLKAELSAARRTAKAASKEHGLFLAVVDEMKSLPPLKAPAQMFYSPRKSRVKESLCMHLSDGHHDQIVEPEAVGGLEQHDFQVSCRRAEQYINTVLEYTQGVMSSYDFEDLTIFAYGDHTSGEIHGACERSQYRNQFKNCFAIGKLHSLMIADLAPYFGSVKVVYLPGNHGRRTKKKDHNGSHNNWDFLIASLAQLHLRDHSNVTVDIPNAFSVDVEVRGHTFNLSHGDDVGGSNGVPLGGLVKRHSNLNRMASMQGRKPVRYSCMGHHHIAGSLQDFNGAVLVNGPWIGTDAYSFNRFVGYREPSQLIHGVNEVHGVTWRLDVHLRTPDELNGPTRYKIAV